jgi:AmmeMemoRadiSam system protein B
MSSEDAAFGSKMAPVSQRLAPLRRHLDVMPSPDPPGLLLRDPFQFTSSVLVIPPPLLPYLAFFDGEKTLLDLKEALVRATGDIAAGGGAAAHLNDSLSLHGFLDDDVSIRMRGEKVRAFVESPERLPSHAGTAYPSEGGVLAQNLGGMLEDGALSGGHTSEGLRGLAAPHVSPEGGRLCYGAAYGLLGALEKQQTFVVLGTSHYGEPDCFGLTRKPFATPLGEASIARPLVDWLAKAGGQAILMEDYCHAVEHSIEFQVIFLQRVFGADISILPVLCGPFTDGSGKRPEDVPGVSRFLEALRELDAREGGRLFWVLGVDMAHVGRRYGDRLDAQAGQGAMALVEERDKARIERILKGDADGFWSLVRENGDDDLKWCGASPIYAFLRAVTPLRGELLRYEQWNIDPKSVVSFAGLSFF